MYKTSVYTLVNGNIKELAHRKQQKSQKVILFSSTLTHSQCDAGNTTFCDFCCFVHLSYTSMRLRESAAAAESNIQLL